MPMMMMPLINANGSGRLLDRDFFIYRIGARFAREIVSILEKVFSFTLNS